MRFMVALLVTIAWSNSAIAQWYSGGTLTNSYSDGEAWTKASKQNRLASAADMALVGIGTEKFQRHASSINDLRPYATELRVCIDEAYGPSTMRMKVTEIGAACIVLLRDGWDRRLMR